MAEHFIIPIPIDIGIWWCWCSPTAHNVYYRLMYEETYRLSHFNDKSRLGRSLHYYLAARKPVTLTYNKVLLGSAKSSLHIYVTNKWLWGSKLLGGWQGGWCLFLIAYILAISFRNVTINKYKRAMACLLKITISIYRNNEAYILMIIYRSIILYSSIKTAIMTTHENDFEKKKCCWLPPSWLLL